MVMIKPVRFIEISWYFVAKRILPGHGPRGHGSMVGGKTFFTQRTRRNKKGTNNPEVPEVSEVSEVTEGSKEKRP